MVSGLVLYTPFRSPKQTSIGAHPGLAKSSTAAVASITAWINAQIPANPCPPTTNALPRPTPGTTYATTKAPAWHRKINSATAYRFRIVESAQLPNTAPLPYATLIPLGAQGKRRK